MTDQPRDPGTGRFASPTAEAQLLSATTRPKPLPQDLASALGLTPNTPAGSTGTNPGPKETPNA